jgi:hypothetical protein
MSSTLVEYILNLKGNLSSGIQQATEHTNKLESAMGGVKTALGAIGLAFGAFQIASFVKEGVEKFHELEQVTAKVEANLKSTGESAGMGLKDIQGYASGLSGKIQAGRADIMDMASQLLTFPAITKDVFQTSMGLVADIAKQTGHGLSETAIMYGKALNSPAEGLQKMMRYGVMFTEAEKQKITALEASGKLIEAQKFMMEAIAHSGYAGVAEKMFNADPIARFNKIMGSAKLAVGEFAMGILKSIMPAFESMAGMIKSTVGFLKEYGTQIEYVVGVYVGYKAIMLGIIAVEKLAIYWKGISTVASELMLGWDMARAEGLGVLTSAQWALNLAMDANPIGLIIMAVTALGAGIYALTQHFGGFTNAMKATWDFMKVALNLAINLWKSLGEMVVGVLMAPFDRGKMFKQGLHDYIDSIKSAASQTQDIWNNKDAQSASKKGLIPEAIAGKAGKAGAPGETYGMPKTKAEGQKTINIHVAYNAPLISGFTISTTNIKDGLGSLKEKVTAILTTATQDSLIIADM